MCLSIICGWKNGEDVVDLFNLVLSYRSILVYMTGTKSHASVHVSQRHTITDCLQLISSDTDNNDVMYNCWWTNKRSQ